MPDTCDKDPMGMEVTRWILYSEAGKWQLHLCSHHTQEVWQNLPAGEAAIAVPLMPLDGFLPNPDALTFACPPVERITNDREPADQQV